MSNADDHVEGACCAQCGVYFAKAHGYPVLCKTCWKDTNHTTRTEMGVQRATEREL